jgi:hypothetical protein
MSAQLYDSFSRTYRHAAPAKIEDDRTAEEKTATIGFWVATDRFMSGWGEALGTSYVACPVVDWNDADEVEKRFRSRSEFKRVRYCAKNWRPKLHDGDHLHIYAMDSFRYPM